MTELEYRTSSFRDELRELIDHNGALRLALEIVGDEARPRGVIEPKPHAHFDTLVAQRYNKQAGIQSALDHLRRLTQPPTPEAPEENELEATPFFHGLPEAVQDALRKQLLKNTSNPI
jgi:hypothetical protein